MLQQARVTAKILENISAQQPALSIQPTSNANPVIPSEHSDSPSRIGSAVEEPAFSPPALDLSSAIGQPLAQLLKRPEITIEHLVPVLRELAPAYFEESFANDGRRTPHDGLDSGSADDRRPTTNDGFADDRRRTTHDASLPSALRNELKSVETEIKYEGYLQQQQRAIERLKKSEQRNIPEWFDYGSVSGLSREMQEKLLKIRPRTLGHASRIPGVTPAAVSLVNVYIEIQARRRVQAATL